MDVKYLILGMLLSLSCGVTDCWKAFDQVEEVGPKLDKVGKAAYDAVRDASENAISDVGQTKGWDNVEDNVSGAGTKLISDGIQAWKKTNGTMQFDVKGASCQYQDTTFACCVDVGLFEFSAKICASVTYLVHDIGLNVKLTVDGTALIDKTVSLRNPPAICAEIPLIKVLQKIFKVCLDVYDLDVSKGGVSGCIQIQIRLVFVISQDIQLGCFTIPLEDVLDKEVLNDPVSLNAWIYKQKHDIAWAKHNKMTSP